MGYFQPWHIILLLLIALLLFGGKRLPEIGRSLGHGMREFKDAVTGNSPAPSTTRRRSSRLLKRRPVEPTTPTTAKPTERETV